jgi:hypothetical protein
MKMSANTSTNTIEIIRSAAFVRGFNSGQTSTSKWVPSRTPTIAPSITIQMKKNRAISSVQIQFGMRPVCRAIICSVTGITRMATLAPSSTFSRRA